MLKSLLFRVLLTQVDPAFDASSEPVGALANPQAPLQDGFNGLVGSPTFLKVRLNAEMGFLFVGRNVIQYGRAGTRFNYVTEGGENNLVPFLRLATEVTLFDQHNFVFLYQPLDVRTQATFARDQIFDGLTYPKGSAVDVRYGFDFYRFSYLYDFIAAHQIELSVGASLQLRNASLSFSSVDGSRRTANNDIGFVPTLKLRGRYGFDNGLFLGLEVDAIYVSGAFIPTGRNARDFEAALYDVAFRAGARVATFAELYGSVRVLGGGARSTSKNPRPGTDGFTDNWLNTVILSLGATVF